jgi:hypothetical protein
MEIVQTSNANGVSSIPSAVPEPPPVSTGLPNIHRREEWIDLEETEYPGYKFLMWANYPKKIELALTSRDEPKVLEALAQIVLRHNGWRDFDGEEYSQPSVWREDEVEDEDGNKVKKKVYPFWEEIPDEVSQLIIVKIHIQTQKLPNSVAESYRLSRISQVSRTRRV